MSAPANRLASRREFLTRSAALLGTTACAHPLLAQMSATSAAKPNIVFFLGEGVRPDESSLAGNTVLHTPNIDSIGRGGAVFNNGFVTNALCVPGRAAVLSGMYGHSTGAIDNQHSKVPANFPIISDLIREAGYEIAFIGKSHVEGALMDHYWDYYFGFDGQANYQNPVITEGRKGKFGEPTTYHQHYVDDLLTERAVAWLREPHSKPICLFLWFYAPHAPFDRPLRKVTEFNGVTLPIPKSFDEYKNGYAGKPKAVADALNKIGMQFFGNDSPRSFEELVKDHYAGVESNDDDMGEVFDVLREKHMLDNTAVVWSSDHGFFLGEHRFYDKRLMYEPSIRVPMMIRYPKRIKPGTIRNEMVLNIDVAPTILDIAGVPIPKTFQGRSMLPLAEGRAIPNWRTDFLYEYYEFPGYENVPPCRGVRTERYVYIDYFTLGEFELYDLQTDPDELKNVYKEASYAPIVRKLRDRLVELRKESDDHFVWHPTKLIDEHPNVQN